MLSELEVDAIVAPVTMQLGVEGSFLRNFVRYAVTQTDGPVEYHVLGGLVALSTAIHSEAKLQFGTGKQSLNLFGLQVGTSGGERKSACQNITAGVLRDACKGGANRVGTQAGSFPGLLDQLEGQPFQCIFDSEASTVLAQTNASSGYLADLKPGITNLYDCLDSNTEILTKDGWRGMGQVKVGDLIWTLNRETEMLELASVDTVMDREVRDGEQMVLIPELNVRVTEGHDFYGKEVDADNVGTDGPWVKLKGRELAARKSVLGLPSMIKNSWWRVEGQEQAYMTPARQGERVWCCSTRNGTLVTRRGGGGRPEVILGNCYPVSNRTRKKPINIPDYRLSMLWAISLPYLQDYTEPSDFTGGFWSRWIFSCATRTRFMLMPDGSQARQEQRKRVVEQLQLFMESSPGGSYVMDPETEAAYAQWAYTCDSRSREVEENLKGLYERAAALTRKVMALLAADRLVANGERYGLMDQFQEKEKICLMTIDDFRAATHVVASHLQSGTRIVEKVAHTDIARQKAKVLASIPKGTLAPLGTVTRTCGIMKKKALEIIETLILEGRVESVLASGKTGTLYQRLDEPERGGGPTQVDGTAALPAAPIRHNLQGPDQGLPAVGLPPFLNFAQSGPGESPSVQSVTMEAPREAYHEPRVVFGENQAEEKVVPGSRSEYNDPHDSWPGSGYSDPDWEP